MQVQVSLSIELSATANLTEMEEQIQIAGKPPMRQALKQAIRQREEQTPGCPRCGQPQRRLEGTVRRSIATTFGRVEVARRRFRCQQCWHRWCPANELFTELKGGTISRPLQEAAILAGCSWPYRVASRLLKRLSGAQISAEEMRLLTNRQGSQRAAQHQEQAERACSSGAEPAPSEQAERACSSGAEPAPSAEKSEQPMLVGLDGGWVGSREQRGGMEGKVGVVCSRVEDLPMPTSSTTFSWSQRGRLHPSRQRHRLVERRFVATFGPSQQLGQQAKAAAQTLCGNPSRPVVVLADGAKWIKQEQARHFPQATCILDWRHLWREVSAAIEVAARAKLLSEQEREYQLHLHRSWLWQGGVDQAVQGLRALATGLCAEPLSTIQKAITYLENQRPWIGSYEHWRKLGSPVGSGMIERAVAIVINRRMKKRGMRWCRPNATAVVALRTDLLNDDWILPQRVRAFP
jgi:transposase-like protein